ncbi:hypothetical protein IWQ61_006386 [Dispira simplex]|nr:hypothetical protein IWQ61_006386 [Dispira simplex]
MCLLLAGYTGAQVQNYARYDHSMAYLGGYLFVAGGRTETDNFTNTSLVLSLSTRVNSNAPNWRVQNGTNVPRGSGMAMTGLNSRYKFQVVLYGGDIPGDAKQYSDHEFAILGQPDGDWNFISRSEIPARRVGSTLTYAPEREVLLILGGREQPDTDQMATDPFDYMYFPATENCVPVRTQSEVPSARFNHGAVMLNSTHLVVVGGMESATQAASLDQVHLLDTLTQTWSQVPTQGSEWFQSLSSSPPVVYEQRLFFFGGRIQDNKQTLASLLVLDTTTHPWTWRNETLDQGRDQDSLQGRHSHTTFAAGQYMFIAFGKTEQGVTDELVVIDLENKRRINEFDPALVKDDPIFIADYHGYSDSAFNSGLGKGLSTGAIVGVVLGSVVGCTMVLLAIWWFVFRRQAQAKKEFEKQFASGRHNSFALFLDKLAKNGSQAKSAELQSP